MDTRRIQVTQGESYMITLPKEWAESMGLKKNDSVNVEVQSDGDLLVSPVKKVEVPKDIKRINTANIKNENYLYRQLIGAYIAGHNMIEAYADHPLSNSVINIVNSFTQTSIGLEVLEEDNFRILIKDLIDHTELRPHKGLERMSILVRKMIDDVFESAVNNDPSYIKDMEKRDVEVDRVHWLISRQNNIYKKDPWLCKKTGSNIIELTNHIAVSRILERIGDHTVLLSKNLMTLMDEKKAVAVDKGIKEIGKEIMKLYSDSVSGWLKTDMDAAEKCIEDGEKIVAKIEKIFKKVEVDLETASSTSLIAGSAKRIGEYCMDISELTINAAMD
ncbi:MAG: phosphate uptake regulator PhoU [Candidatus Methanoplasma sp.]|jgi:AbrB family looped-hinge helix DNA binding protein|nr:phosphate uptake regulator PhoU [Candidatus Methanoplasma sp.]